MGMSYDMGALPYAVREIETYNLSDVVEEAFEKLEEQWQEGQDDISIEICGWVGGENTSESIGDRRREQLQHTGNWLHLPQTASHTRLPRRILLPCGCKTHCSCCRYAIRICVFLPIEIVIPSLVLYPQSA